MSPFDPDALQDLKGEYELVPDPDHGFLRIEPRPTEAELLEAYGTSYQPSTRPHDPEGRVDLVTRHHPEPGRVVDIGCGQGEFLEVFAERGWETLGVEPGARDAEVARAKGIEVIEEPLTPEVADKIGTFDAVFMSHVLEHVVDPVGIVEHVHRITRPGGTFLCEVPNDFNPLQEAAVEVHDLDRWWICPPHHLNYFTIDSLSSLVEAHGFEVLHATTDFPMELFLLFGDVYVGDDQVGKAMHERRCRFEEALRETGRGDLLNALYDALAGLGIGREAIVVAKREG